MINELEIVTVQCASCGDELLFTMRLVPLVEMSDVHEAECAFFERHPGTQAVIEDWMENINTLVHGHQPYPNIVGADCESNEPINAGVEA